MKKYYSLLRLIITLFLNYPLITIATSFSQSTFREFNNNVVTGINATISNSNYTQANLDLEAQFLFKNNLWFNLKVATELYYTVTNNSNQNIRKLYNNASGSEYSLMAGYALQASNKWNFTPFAGVSHTSLLTAYHTDSLQQFIINDPATNWLVGIKTEFILIPHSLKFATAISNVLSYHKAVFPNSNILDTLGHYNYTNYTFQIKPELQWNFAKIFTLITYYQLGISHNIFNANNPAIYFFPSNVYSNEVIANNSTQNSFGIKFGMAF